MDRTHVAPRSTVKRLGRLDQSEGRRPYTWVDVRLLSNHQLSGAVPQRAVGFLLCPACAVACTALLTSSQPQPAELLTSRPKMAGG